MSTRLFDVDPLVIGHKWSAEGNRRRWRATNGQDIRRTPRALFDELDAEFRFTARHGRWGRGPLLGAGPLDGVGRIVEEEFDEWVRNSS